MSVVEGLKRSGAARVSLRSLVILAYLVYVVGTVLGAGLDRAMADFPLNQYVAATIALVAVLLWVNWFFQSEPVGGEAGPDASANDQ